MICLYWKIGKAILDKQMTDGWGAKVIDRISADLKEAFPDWETICKYNTNTYSCSTGSFSVDANPDDSVFAGGAEPDPASA